MVEYVATKAGSLQRSSWMLIALLLLVGCQTTEIVTQSPLSPPPIAAPDENLVVLDHKYFTVYYDKAFRLARYVRYSLSSAQLAESDRATRSDKFKADPLLVSLKGVQVLPKEYLKSGYDQGHLANSKDFGFSQEAQDTTFYMSNLSPQAPNLNRDAWLKLENQVRLWACGEKEVEVITGPVLKEGLPTFKSGLAIPAEFFKVVLDKTPPEKMLAFVYFQTDKGDVMTSRAVTKEALEEKLKTQVPELKMMIEAYPVKPVADWASVDCFTKKKAKKVVSR
ncbi:DNA/RNA non-specific endonuclease [Bdellovibrio sp. HCB290]|uniref:DNA/RNA non-specific endonuclease n=1 Tax=Bdellovibrio sp. HCB290 TaxID=3394356 RepID=UPI0039B5727B